jgi:hypothetical protein
MKNKKLKKISLTNLIIGYLCALSFLFLIISNMPSESPTAPAETADATKVLDADLFISSHGEEIVYLNRHETNRTFITDYDVGVDRGARVILDEDPDILIRRNNLPHNTTIVSNSDRIALNDRNLNRDLIIDEELANYGVGSIARTGVSRGIHTSGGINDVYNEDHLRGGLDEGVDHGLLERRLAELDSTIENEGKISLEDEFGIDGANLAGLTLSRDGDDLELGELDPQFEGLGKNGFGFDKGDLYAYNYPSQGVGAGIGSGAVGAGAGGGAGLGAGIGEAVLGGKTVPALGGVGTYSSVPIVPPGTGTDTDRDGLTAEAEALLGTDPTKADSDGDGYTDGAEVSSYTDPSNPASNPGVPGSTAQPTLGGVAGLVGGAGAGGAAGLVTGIVKERLGVGVGAGSGKGCAEHGAGCNGRHGKHEYDLPPDGALHIMMHVDGSGSILNTRKQLEIMKDTLLKDALLPYYNNDETLYNRRVMIVGGNGERTLQFFTQATKTANVLALVFQDEAAPAYHLPTFNKKPQDHYAKDLQDLKAGLNRYGGLYRGVMFQVDRGRTFAKSFKEFVECAWQGTGYLRNSNLKKYYWEENKRNIEHKEGIVFSDEYHAKDSGDPQYYLDLIINASQKVGLDLRAKGAGLTDGKFNDR